MTERYFNKLTPAQAERLALLAEECGEVVQAVGKILRHGYRSHHPQFRDCDNRETLEEEIGDLTAAVRLLSDAGDIVGENVVQHAESKLERVEEFLHHAKVPK